jgi:hypothetical protein
LKSEYVSNIPPHIEKQIKDNDARIAVLVNRVENLFR